MQLRRSDAVVQWQTKILAHYLASTVPNEKAQRLLHDAADSINIWKDPDRKTDAGDTPPEGEYLPDDMRDRGRVAELRALERNAPGSFERFALQTARSRDRQ